MKRKRKIKEEAKRFPPKFSIAREKGKPPPNAMHNEKQFEDRHRNWYHYVLCGTFWGRHFIVSFSFIFNQTYSDLCLRRCMCFWCLNVLCV